MFFFGNDDCVHVYGRFAMINACMHGHRNITSSNHDDNCTEATAMQLSRNVLYTGLLQMCTGYHI